MQGDFSRLTFDARMNYRSVLLQQGRVLLDADWNEQAELTAHRDEVRTRDILGPHGGFAGEAGFAIVDSTSVTLPEDSPWSEIHLSPGRYYVDGIRCDASRRGGDPGPVPLSDQPYLPAPGLPEPALDGPYALYLDLWTRLVTADGDPALREPALGGPDTTTRAQTVWQVRIQPIGPSLGIESTGTMIASLSQGEEDIGTGITTSSGYTLLENQLYRIQIHDTTGDHPTFLWSRENGSVVAALRRVTVQDADLDSELLVDRVGRDDKLSIGAGDIVEVTSTDRELRGEPGYLAKVVVPDELRLPVRWIGTPPTDLASLGRVPVVRRWEMPPEPATTDPVELEGGIRVAFPPGGTYRSGDYWLVPARAVRLAYGLSGLPGTIDWPTSQVDGTAVPLPPHGPIHHIAPLAILSRHSGEWRLDTDCRRLAPNLTELLTFDLVGGDAQEAPPKKNLPYPIQVAVRNGGRPVVGVPVDFIPFPGGSVNGQPGAAIRTDTDGIASATWRLKDDGPTTQTLTARWLDHTGAPVRPEVTATGRVGAVGPDTVTVTVNASLVGDLKGDYGGDFAFDPSWLYDPGLSRVPGDAVEMGGWMPVVLPHGYRITSLRVVCDKSDPSTIEATLWQQVLDDSSSQRAVIHFMVSGPTMQTSSSSGSGSLPKQGPLTHIDNKGTPQDAELALIDNSQFGYFIRVHVKDSLVTDEQRPETKDRIVAFQVACDPVR